MGYTYETRDAVATMVRAAVPHDGHYDIEAITAYLWMKTDVNSGFMDVTVGEFWDVVDSNRIDLPQLRSTAHLVAAIVFQKNASILSDVYEKPEGMTAPVYRVDVEHENENRQWHIKFIDVQRNSPVVKIFEILSVGFEPPYDEEEVMTTDDATQALAKLAELLS
jgi:hypothetical protein